MADGVKMLVVACNSASAASLRDARERYDVPVVEVVLPAVRRATAATRNGRVGVIGTQATITSGAYEDAFAAAPQITVTSAACPSFVDFVERGVTSGRQLLGLAQSYLDPLLAAGVDTVVLGLHALPAAHRRHLAGDGGRRHAGVQRRGDGQGRLPGAHRAPTCCATRTARRPSTASSPPATPSRSPGWAAGSSAPRSARCCTPHRWVPREADRRRLLRQRPGAEVARLQLPRRARRVPAAARPRQRRVRPAAGATSTRRRIDAVFLSHLHADHCLDVAPFVVWHRYAGAAGPQPGAAVRAGRRRAAAGARLRHGRRRAHRRLRLRAGRARVPSRSGRSRSRSPAPRTRSSATRSG